MSNLLRRLTRAVKRRPVRVLEAVLVLASAAGLTLAPELRESVMTLVAALAPAVLGVVGGEAAQRKTHSRDYVDNDLRDAETNGPPGDDAEPHEPVESTLGAVPDAIYGEKS